MPASHPWCARCGGAAGDEPGVGGGPDAGPGAGPGAGSSGGPGTHDTCERALLLEPPRYCTRCRRRMTVQVLPCGWSARCVEHGVLTSGVTAARG